MVDPEKLIATIMADTKFVTSGNFASRVYRDEPILLTASQMERFTPSKYRAMRKMARGLGFNRASEARIFYEQGKFMEDFEDDYNYEGDFVRYFPTYQAMNDHQLRGYFSWRTKVRRCLIEKTSLSFVFVYVYELLNLIGARSPKEGFESLKTFGAAYAIDPQIGRYLRPWLKDFVIYHNLDRSLLPDLAENSYDQPLLTLMDFKSHNPQETFRAISALSSYNLENSRYFKEHAEETQSVVYDVWAMLSDHYDKKCKNGLFERYFGRISTQPYSMFSSAVFYEPSPPDDFIYEINPIDRFICRNGHWSRESFLNGQAKNQELGALVKTIDFFLRQKAGYKSTLKAGKTTKILEIIIKKAINNFSEKQNRAARAEINIDVSKLQKIRATALVTQSKLIIDEETTEAPAHSRPPVEIPYDGAAFEPSARPKPLVNHSRSDSTLPQLVHEARLNEIESLFLSGLLNGHPYLQLIPKGLMPSVLIDSINEKLFDLFGDTVIIETGDQPELIEDYVDQLKEIIQA